MGEPDPRAGDGRRDGGSRGRLSRSRRARGELAEYAPALFATILICIATLASARDSGAGGWSTCFFCGSRGTADILLNVVLFLPFGIGIGRPTKTLAAAVVLSAAFSASIELLQQWVPGRDPALSDIVFNTLGSVIGFLAVRHLRGWTRPRRHLSARLSLLAAMIFAALIAGSGALFQSSFPRSTYFGQWTADLGDLEVYQGRVVNASIGGISLPSRELGDSEGVRELLLAGSPLTVRAIVGPPPGSLAPLFSIYDHRQREILFLGVEGSDMVIRSRTRATAARLDQPEWKIAGALEAHPPGSPLVVVLQRDGVRRCVQVDAREWCHRGFSAGNSWNLLLSWESLPYWVGDGIDFLWLAAVALPFGFWARRRPESLLAAAVLVASIVLLPPRSGLRPTPLDEVIAVALGVMAGAAGSRLLDRQEPLVEGSEGDREGHAGPL